MNKKFFWLASLILAALMLTSSFVTTDVLAQRSRNSRYSTNNSIPRGTEMKIRLNTTIDSQKAKDGDRFKATALSPNRYADASISGHVSQVKQSGKVKGKTSLVLVFDSITLSNGENYSMRGDVVKVYGEKSVKKVDEEGKIESGSRGSSTAKRTVGGAAAGAILGGILGGGKGAAIGATVGAAGGAGSNVIRGSDKIKLDEGTEILVRTR
jgi:outer membrane lipoprotein SlyB